MATGNYSATSNNMKLVHWLLMCGLLHLVYSDEGTGRGPSSPRLLLAVPNVTDVGSESRFLPIPLAFDGPVNGVLVGILP